MNWLALLKPILGFISEPIKGYFKNRKELKLAEHTRNLAVINNQARLAQDKQSNNHAWEMASLQDKDKWLRYLSFFLFTSPVIVAVTSPETAAELFLRLEDIPDWLLQIWFYMIAGVWGLASMKDSVPQIIASFRKK